MEDWAASNPKQSQLLLSTDVLLSTSLGYLNRWSGRVDTVSDWQSEILSYPQRGFTLGQGEGNILKES